MDGMHDSPLAMLAAAPVALAVDEPLDGAVDSYGAGEPRKDEAADIPWLLSAPRSVNLVDDLDESKVAGIGRKVVDEYEIDKASRAGWEKRNKRALDLAMQVASEKSWPWPKAANVKYPLMTSAAIQFAARAYPAIVNGRTVARAKVVGRDDDGEKRSRSARITEHMNYQILDEMEEWEEDTDRLLHQLPIVGCAFRKTWFDPALGRNRSEMIPADRMVVNYWAKSLNTATRVTHVYDLYPHEVLERERAGTFCELKLGSATDGDSDDDAPHEFLEQHRLLDLDEDGYPEPYIVVVHKDTAKVARIVARWDPDGVALNGRGEVRRIEADHYFTKYSFMPSPDGSFYDIGFGALLEPINETVNTILNQLLDAGTLANTGGGFIGKGLRMRGGSIRFAPGEYKMIDAQGGTIRDSIVPMQFPGPSAVLFQLLGMLIEAGREIASVKDVLTGEQQSSNVPATTTLALIEQGLKVFTAIYKRIHRALKDELAKLYRLNAKFLPPEVYFTVLDDQRAVAQRDYQLAGCDVVPVSDPSVVSDMQRLGRAQFLMQFANDPMMDRKKILLRILEAGAVEDVDDLIAKEAPQAPPELAAAAAKLEIERGKLALEEQRVLTERMALDLSAAKTTAEIEKIRADAMRSIAEAEAKEAGTQLAVYRQQVEDLRTAVDLNKVAAEMNNAGAGQPGGLGAMVEPSAGPQAAPVPQGLPPFADGGVGGGLPGDPGLGLPGQMPSSEGPGGPGIQ